MTFGRPSMTSHVSPTPLPMMAPQSQSDDPCELSGQSCDHQFGYMTFYVSTIELYKILESILSDIYNAWQSHSNIQRPASLRDSKHSSLDVIMELDDKLSSYEANVPSVLNWTDRQASHSSTNQQGSLFKRQRNVLRARYWKPLYTLLVFCLTLTDLSTFAYSYTGLCSPSSAQINGWALHDRPGRKPARIPHDRRRTLSTLPCLLTARLPVRHRPWSLSRSSTRPIGHQ